MGSEVERIRSKLEKLEEALIEGRISEATYKELKEKYEKRLRELELSAAVQPPAAPAAAPAARPTAPKRLPPGVQERLTPAALALLFEPELYGPTGIHKDPKRKVYLRQVAQLALMTSATLLSMEANGHATLHVGQVGRIMKRKTVVVTKKSPFAYSEYGYLARKVYEAPMGSQVYVFEMLVDPEFKRKPWLPDDYASKIADKTLKMDLTPQTYDFLFYWEERELKRSLLDRVVRVPKKMRVMNVRLENAEFYRDQVRELKSVLERGFRGRPGFFRVVYLDCLEAIAKMS